MKFNKFMAFFVAIVLVAAVIYPLSVVASSHKDKYAVESESNNTHGSDDGSVKPEDHHLDKPQGHGQENAQENRQEHPKEHSQEHNQGSSSIAQTAPDEGDNRHPSGKDRSEEHGKSETQGKSNSDPDGKENVYGGISGKDKQRFDGGLDKGDQDGNNGCGNDDDFEDDNNGNCMRKNKVPPTRDPKTDHPGKNAGGCDANGSTGDKNGRPCDPGKNNASPRGCERGEPDCDDKNEKPKEKPKEEQKPKEDNNTNISVVINVNNQINNQQSTNVSNQQSTQPAATQVLGASTLAATGDSLFKIGIAGVAAGISSFLSGLFFLARYAFKKVFRSAYQSYLYLYEA